MDVYKWNPSIILIISRLESVFGQISLSYEEAMIEWHDDLELKVRMSDACMAPNLLQACKEWFHGS
tara:strand:- start:42 stop:239 length:198 start_codon:yes stop_codon:yes gene_type:complete